MQPETDAPPVWKGEAISRSEVAYLSAGWAFSLYASWVQGTRMEKKPRQTRFDATALILAGGRGLRMGTEKPLVELGGLPLVDNVKETLRPHFAEIIIVTNRPELYTYEDILVVRDRVPYQGPLAGIYAGLAASSNDRNLVIASDMPFVNLEAIEMLYERIDGSVVAVIETGTGIEPLLGFYSRRCLEPIGRRLEAGERKPVSFYPDVEVALVPESEARSVDPELTFLFNVNTRDDLAKAQAIMEHSR